MMDKSTSEYLLQAIDRMQGSLDSLRVMVIDAAKTVGKEALPAPIAQKQLQLATSLPASELGPLVQLDDVRWPVAMTGARTASALQALPTNYKGMTVLEVGCGDGQLSKLIAATADKVVGYDIVQSASWTNDNNNLKFATKKKQVEELSYDYIIAYDMLDHVQGESQLQLVHWLASILNAPNGKMFVRTHPWTSKHGGHLHTFDGYNKAFAHLLFTADELAKMGVILPPVVKLNRPMAAYAYLFKNAGLQVLDRKIHTDKIDPFFSGVVLDRILKTTWAGKIEPEAALKIMSNSWIDYTLSHDPD